MVEELTQSLLEIRERMLRVEFLLIGCSPVMRHLIFEEWREDLDRISQDLDDLLIDIKEKREGA